MTDKPHLPENFNIAEKLTAKKRLKIISIAKQTTTRPIYFLDVGICQHIKAIEDTDFIFFTNLKAPPPKLILINSFSDKKPFFGKSSSESSSAAALRQYLPYSAAAAAVSACSPGSSSATSTASHQSPKHFETSDHSVRKKIHSLLTMFHISRKTFTFAEVHSSW